MSDWSRIKSYSELVSDFISSVSAHSPFTNFNVGGKIRTLIEILAKLLADLYNLLNTVVAQSFITSATGKWLDLKVEEVGVTRLVGVKTQIYLKFTRETTSGDLTIPAGTIAKTIKDSQGVELRFVTLSEGTIWDGDTSAVILAEAEEIGAKYNVGPSTVTRIVTTLNGVRSVDNPEAVSVGGEDVSYLYREGSDSETDAHLRERARLKWETLGLGGTRDAYRNWAMSVDGVTAVSVLDDFPFGPGTVGVVILGTAGSPSGALVDEVRTYIEARKPLTADVRVMGPETVEQDLTLTIQIDPASSAPLVKAEVEAALEAYNTTLGIGQGLILSHLIKTVLEVPGVLDVTFTDPASNVAVPRDSFAEFGTITVNSTADLRQYQAWSSSNPTAGDLTTGGGSIPEVNRDTFEL